MNELFQFLADPLPSWLKYFCMTKEEYQQAVATDTVIRTRNRRIFEGEQFRSPLDQFKTTSMALNPRPAATVDNPFGIFDHPNINTNRQKRRVETEEMAQRREQIEEAERQVESKHEQRKQARAEWLLREEEE